MDDHERRTCLDDRRSWARALPLLCLLSLSGLAFTDRIAKADVTIGVIGSKG